MIDKSTGDKRLSRFITMYLLIQALNILVKQMDILSGSWGILSKLVLAIFLLDALRTICARGFSVALLAEGCALFCFSFSFLLGNYNSDLWGIAFDVMAVHLPLGICAYFIYDEGILLKSLYKNSFFTHAIIYYLFFYLNSKNLLGNLYDNAVGYILLIQLLIVINRFLNERKWYDLVISIIDLTMILIGGTRGPLVCFLAFIILKMLFSDIKKKIKVAIISFFSLLTVGVIVFYESIIKVVIGLLSNYGYSSRSLYVMLTDPFNGTGRDRIYSEIIKKIGDKPIIGWGVTGGWIGDYYPHNIFLELLLSFGVILGTLLALLIVYETIAGMKRADSSGQMTLFIFIAEATCLLVSDSFLKHSMFFVYLFLCIKHTRERRGALYDYEAK